MFAKSLPVALGFPVIFWTVSMSCFLVGGLVIGGELLVEILFTIIAMAIVSPLIHLAHYSAAAAFFFVVGLTPNSIFWKFQWGLPAGAILGALTVFISMWLFQNGWDYPAWFFGITGAYGAITAFAVIRARRKLLAP